MPPEQAREPALAELQALIDTLRREPARLPFAVPAGEAVELIETHLSWVLLAGAHALKFKKPLHTDFVDFSTLAQREAACHEELRINRRTAPALYLGVLAVRGTPAAPHFGGAGPLLAHAVCMRRFPADALLATRLAQGVLTATQVDALAQVVAAFHAQCAVAPQTAPHGPAAPHAHAHAHAPAAVRQAAGGNLLALAQAAARPGAAPALAPAVAALRAWTQREGTRLAPLMAARLAAGRVRECHGDLHLGNLLWLDGAPVLFDAIEFSPALRWIDVLADSAFLFMDLYAHQRADLAWRFLDGWLQTSGDHAALALLPYFATYRALVRAKVAALRATQCEDRGEPAAARGAQAELWRYLRLAAHLSGVRAGTAPWAAPPLVRARPTLWLTMGVSGSGKSTHSQPLVSAQGIVRLRADVERKRLHGLAPLAGSRHLPDSIYTHAASERTFAHLLAQARTLLQAGLPVLVDATFIQHARRAPFIALAQSLGLPWRILAFEAPEAVLRERVRQRHAAGSDASEADEAVLASQLAHVEPLDAHEAAHALRIDTTQPVDWPALLATPDADAPAGPA